jgi:acyl carrier protein
MDFLSEIKSILTDILDIEGFRISEKTYLIRDLEAESIDLLELAVCLNAKFKIEVNDDEIYLKQLRAFIDEAQREKSDIIKYLAEKYPFLSPARIEEILADLDGGPALKIKDLISYVKWQRK